MNISLKHINTVKKRLANGSISTYYYAWKGGPRLTGTPGSPEFIASYNDAMKSGHDPKMKCLKDLINKYTSSPKFDRLKDNSKYSNLGRFRQIQEKLGDLPLSAFGDPKIIDVLDDWREAVAIDTPASANGQWDQLSAMLKWAVRRSLVKTNPCVGAGANYRGSRVDKIWSEPQVAKFVAGAPSHMVIAFMLALWTGQREGDLVDLRWSQYDGDLITVTQIKQQRGQPRRTVVIPVMGQFKEYLDGIEQAAGVVGLSVEERQEKHVVLNVYGQPWASAASFSGAFGRFTHDVVGIEDRTFHDLRGTAITRLARAECTVPQIATITGHSLKTVQNILDRHYLHRDRVLAEQAMRKRDAYEASQPDSQLALLTQ
jgi:integrase